MGEDRQKSVIEMRIFCISVRDKIFPGDSQFLHLRCINTVENNHVEKKGANK